MRLCFLYTKIFNYVLKCSKKQLFVDFFKNWSTFGNRIATYLNFSLFISFYIDSEHIKNWTDITRKVSWKSKLEKLEKFFLLNIKTTWFFLISECNLKLRLKTSFWIEIALVQANCFYQKKNSEGRCPCNFITNRLGIENSDVFLAIAWKLVDHCKQSGSKSLNIGGQTRK